MITAEHVKYYNKEKKWIFLIAKFYNFETLTITKNKSGWKSQWKR